MPHGRLDRHGVKRFDNGPVQAECNRIALEKGLPGRYREAPHFSEGIGRGGGDRKYKLLNKACALYALQSSTLSNRNKQNNAPSNHRWLGRLGADAGSFAPVFLENRKKFYYAEGANSLRIS